MFIIHAIIGIFLAFVIFFGPSILIVLIGWKLTRKIANEYMRIVVRTCAISVALTPVLHGPCSPVFALWMIFLGSGSDRLTYGLLPILVVFLVGSILTLCLRWLKNHNVKHRVENT